MSNSAHRWKFFRAGGFDQVRLGTGADLMNLGQLDQKLWMALACPTQGLDFDPKTLQLIDTDADGRIRAPELIAAVKWAGSILRNPDDLIKGGEILPLTAINESVPEGQQLANCARQILKNMNKAGSAAISLADASDAEKVLAATSFNGDGIIIPESADAQSSRTVVEEIMACLGSITDRSGKQGIDQGKADAFFEACAAFDGWMKLSEADSAKILPAGDGTAAASAAVKTIKGKVDDYFARCRLAAFDPQAGAALNCKGEDYLALSTAELSFTASETSRLPLARVEPGKPLPLESQINPAHAAAVAELRAKAVKPLLGETAILTEDDWLAIQERLAPYHAWIAQKAGAAVESLGIARVREILSSSAKDDVNTLIAKDKVFEPEAASIAKVEKLIRLVRDLRTLCTNFVNFETLYGGIAPAIFQCGILYLDQRSCHLCLTVEDVGRHAVMAGLAGAYLAYCECQRKSDGERMSIVALITQGDDDNLMVGRNGVFYDRKGRDYDATITKIVSNPISLRQAFWLPYKKLVRLIEQQVIKRAAAAEAASDAKMGKAAAETAQADKAKPPEQKKVDVGTVAALGVAFGAIGTFAAALAGYAMGVVRLGPLAILGAIIGIILVISGPSMILAYIKLRKRNLAPILDANGWAMNGKVRINVPFGVALTQIAKLPPGAERDLADNFAEKKNPWPGIIVACLLLYVVYSILNYLGFINQWTGGRMGTPN